MSTWNPENDVFLTDSEDEEDLKKNFLGRDAVLFVIDANLYSNLELFSETLELIRNAFISGLLLNDKDLVGVMFANTEMSPEPFEASCLENISVPENCSVFLPLRQPNKAIAEHYLRFMATAATNFGTEYGIAGNGGRASFATMIRLCLNLFEHCGYNLVNAQIVYLTDKEAPHESQTHEHQMALQKAKDLEGREIDFHVIPMVDEFNYDIFYKEFLALVRDIELDSFVPQDPQQLREMLTERKFKQNYLRRSLGHFKFSLGPNLEISALYYNYFNSIRYPRKVKMLRKDNTILERKYKVTVSHKDPDTAELVKIKEIKHSDGWYDIECNNQAIRITPEQMVRVRNLHPPGMMLLGFKSKDSLPNNLYYHPHNFMYPDEQSIVGSKRLFYALWERCMAREKIAVCLFMRKRRSIPRFVALLPVALEAQENAAEQSAMVSGDGFKIIYLPMAEHIRDSDFMHLNSIENAAPSEGVDICQKLIKKLRIKYQPQLFSEPHLESLQTNLLALALNIHTDGNVKVPDVPLQDERMSSLLPEFANIFGEDAEVAKKRAASNAVSQTAPKKAKLTENDLKDLARVKELAAKQELEQCTVAQLRFVLEEHFNAKLPKKAVKNNLIELITTELSL